MRMAATHEYWKGDILLTLTAGKGKRTEVVVTITDQEKVHFD